MEEFNKKDKMFGREVKTIDIFMENQILLDIALDLKDSLGACFLLISSYRNKHLFNSHEEEKVWIEIITEAKNTLEKYKSIREYVKLELKKIETLRNPPPPRGPDPIMIIEGEKPK